MLNNISLFQCNTTLLLLVSRSVMSDSATPLTAACQSSLSFTISRSLLKLMSIELVMPSSYLVLFRPLFLLPSIFPSIRYFSSESAIYIRWPKYWSFSFNISSSSEYSGWFPLGWTDLISLQSKGLSRVFSSTTVPRHQFFDSLPSLQSISHNHYVTIGKTIALTVHTLLVEWCLCFSTHYLGLS